MSFKETFPSGLRRELGILFGAVGLLLLIAAGIVLGLGGSLFAVRFIENQIWKVPKSDWISFLGIG